MEQLPFSLSLRKGLQTDQHLSEQPADSYRDALNLVTTPELARKTDVLPRVLAQVGIDSSRIIGLVTLGEQVIVVHHEPDHSTAWGVLTGEHYQQLWYSAVCQTAGPLSLVARYDYRGHRLVYFTDGVAPVRKLDLDAGSWPTTAEDMRLLVNPALPTIANVRDEDGGELAGVVQIAVRLLTASLAATSFTLPTAPLPLSGAPTRERWSSQDGGLNRPGSRLVRATVSGLPAGFRYLQVALITYDPYSGEPIVRVQPNIELAAGQTSADILVAKVPDTPLTLNELAVDPANIDTAEYLRVAKGALLLCGVSVGATDQYDWQPLANACRLRWTIKRVAYDVPKARPQRWLNNAGGTDTSNNPVGLPLYYDSTFAAEYRSLQRNEVYAFALSPIIEGDRTQAGYHIACVPTYDERSLYPFLSEERYPVGRGYPTELDGTPARIHHFRMPAIEQCPLVEYESEARTWVNILGVELELPANLEALIPAAIRSRVKGFRLVRQQRTLADSTILAQGLVQPMQFNNQVAYPSLLSGSEPWKQGDAASTMWRQRAAFYSLDTLMGGVDVRAATSCDTVALMEGEVTVIDNRRTNGDNNDPSARYVHTFNHYFIGGGRSVFFNSSTPLLTSLTQTIGAGDNQVDDIQVGDGRAYSLRNQNGYVLLATEQSFPVPNWQDMYWQQKSNATDLIFLRQQSGSYLSIDQTGTGYSKRVLANLVRARPSQYGRLEQAVYQPAGETPAVAGRYAVFRGDVYVQPAAILLSTQERESKNANGVRGRQLLWFWGESRVNAARRHYDLPTNDQAGTLPYYPLSRVLYNSEGTGLLQLPVASGHAVGYNKSYSLEDRLTGFFTAQLSADEQVQRYTNRTLHSAELVEGDRLDAWQLFRGNDYYDLPSHRGKMTDVFELGGVLYQRTEQSLFRAFFKEGTAIATTSGELAMGTGQGFSRPSQDLFSADNGYGGGPALGSVSTPAGRVMLTPQNQQCFLFSGNSNLQELGRAHNCRTLLAAFLGGVYASQINASVFDLDNMRVLLLGENSTLSYSLLDNGQFVARHNYGAHFAVACSNRVILARGRQLLTLHQGLPAERTELYAVAAPNGTTEVVFEVARLQGEGLPSQFGLVSETGNSGLKTVRLHKGFRDIHRAAGELVVRPFPGHYNLSLPPDTARQRISGQWAALQMIWQQPMLLRAVQVYYSPITTH